VRRTSDAYARVPTKLEISVKPESLIVLVFEDIQRHLIHLSERIHFEDDMRTCSVAAPLQVPLDQCSRIQYRELCITVCVYNAHEPHVHSLLRVDGVGALVPRNFADVG
jgi:hypothetical protein